MANPYRSEAKSTGAVKYKNIAGRSGSANPFDGGREMSDKLTGSIKGGKEMPRGDLKATGENPKTRLDKYARGGRAKKGNNVTINIVTPRAPSGAPPDVGAGGPLPPVGPPPDVGVPPGGPPIGPVAAGPGGPPPVIPGGPPIPMRKQGGKVMAKKWYGGGMGRPAGLPVQAAPQAVAARPAVVPAGPPMVMRAAGGKVGNKYVGGGDSGVGRLEKIKSYGLKPSKKG